MNELDRVREICLALPGAYEKIAWNAPTFRVGKRQFAMYADNHHGDGRVGLWCKAPEGAQEELVASSPDCFFVPPYVGPSGWIGIRLDRGLDWGVVATLVAEAYREAAPKPRAPRAGAGRKAGRGTSRDGGDGRIRTDE